MSNELPFLNVPNSSSGYLALGCLDGLSSSEGGKVEGDE
jgi:hypothetical protein